MSLTSTRPPTRITVIGLETVAAVSAVGGGIGLAANNAIGMPADWLAATPFTSWLVPGIALIAVVALPMAAAAVAEICRWPKAPAMSFIAGTLQVMWIILQWGLIQKFNWLQPTMLVLGAAVMILALWPQRATR